VFLSGVILHFIEIYLLWQNYNIFPLVDYVFGTYFMGIGMAMVSLSNHSILRIRSLSETGKMTLGIYVVHIVYVDLFSDIDESINSAFWEIGYIFLVLFLSIVSVKILQKNKITRKIVI